VNPDSHPGLDALARFGYFARGAVYLVMGGIAARAALLSRGRAMGPGGALRAILGGPRGQLLVGIIAAGLLAFAVFRLVQALGAQSRGFLRRISSLGGGLASAGLAYTAWRVMIHERAARGRGAGAFREMAARVLAHPWGRNLLIAGGAIAAIAGIVEILRALSGRFPERFLLGSMGPGRRKWALRLTRFGLAAHGVLVLTVGVFVARAGLDTNAREVLETGGALRRLGQPPFGSLTAGAVALGLSAYGLYMWFLARYRKRS
jgi:hypothetical protein